jgi:hypothetical protein
MANFLNAKTRLIVEQPGVKAFIDVAVKKMCCKTGK